MKKLTLTLSAWLVAFMLQAQDGKVAFNNTGGGLAPLTVGGFTADNNFTVELVYEGSVIGSTPILANGFFQGPEVAIPGVGGSTEFMATIRAYNSSVYGSWEEARAASILPGSNIAFIAGASQETTSQDDLQIALTTGAITTPPSPAPGLGGGIAASGGWAEVVPEPGVLAFGMLGLLTLAGFRRNVKS